MKLDVRALIPAVLALLLLVVTVSQTAQALKQSGAWATTARHAPARPMDPYVLLDAQLEQRQSALKTGAIRDPFTYGAAPRPQQSAVRTYTPPPLPRPVLTAILADNDPRALIRYEERSYSVKNGELFARFRVISITAQEVVLEDGGQRMVLRLPGKGD